MTIDISKVLENYPPQETGKYQPLGWMPASKFAALLGSIQLQGQVQVPIIKDSDGNILDGHHRELAHKQLKIREALKVQTLGAMSEDEKRHYALLVNLVRRQITRKQRRELIADELRRTPDLSNSAIAEVVGTTKKTVKSVRDELVANGEIPQLERLRRKNGGHYPVAQIVSHDNRTTQRAQTALRRLGKDAPSRAISVQNAEGLVRRKKRQQRAQVPVPNNLPKTCQIQHADFRDIDLAECSVDLLITDPPYEDKFLPEWADLAKHADRVLKPGGVLVAYTGIAHLPAVMSSLSANLNYVWTVSLRLMGGSRFVSRIMGRSSWRPVLIFAKGEYTARRGFVDSIDGITKEKELHDWQQSIAEARKLIDLFSEPGDLVFDPFAGSFTNGIAAHELGRRFFGCDIEEQNVSLGKHRLADAIKAAKDDRAVAGKTGPAKTPRTKSA